MLLTQCIKELLRTIWKIHVFGFEFWVILNVFWVKNHKKNEDLSAQKAVIMDVEKSQSLPHKEKGVELQLEEQEVIAVQLRPWIHGNRPTTTLPHNDGPEPSKASSRPPEVRLLCSHTKTCKREKTSTAACRSQVSGERVTLTILRVTIPACSPKV